ncbi:MAG: fatty acid desaturase [Oscillatoriaceae bacterium SKW80]|nr:fatty acid desaturase [Oscillatoriaceae bacterium SKYG93]MCX8121879.1 fatty acid desaturase [Oscillatoriaceae bacterium SKW80]MDW8454640.1 fatty acid desaturase [Oscillatoriaceae cyanobacterium SKYGB_i_bin93]
MPLRPKWPVIIFMVAVHLLALLALLPSNFSWAAVGLAVFLHWVTGGLGITLGFHRLVTHRSFQTPKWLEYFLIFCGSLTCQGGVIDWVGLHRIHHLHSDKPADPHDSNKGFLWSHMTCWFYHLPADKEIPRYTKDIADDPVYQFLNKYFFPIQIALGVALYFLGEALSPGLGWPFVVWGIFVRLVAVFHCTWLVNSATHMFGYRTYDSDDRSTNCWWVALLTYGEGWHNNHHAFQYSARHGMQWWEIDITWMTIQLLQALGLATKVKLVEK